MYLVPAEKYSEAPQKYIPLLFPRPPQHTVSISSTSAKEEEEDEEKENEKEEDKKTETTPYEKWVKYRKKMRWDEVRRMTQMHAIADFLQKSYPSPLGLLLLRSRKHHLRPAVELSERRRRQRRKKQTVLPPQPSTSMAETFASTPKSSFAEISDDDDDDDDNVFVEEDAQAFGRENVGPIASPYIVPYLYNRRYLDTQYDLR